jgi:HK97 family phage major capsid protein/HK97 family phage prohead protease
MADDIHEAFPRENLVRAVMDDGVHFRATDPGVGDGRLGTLTGAFAVFNQWTEINSMWEGNFIERIAPSAFKKTVAENLSGMRVLFQHGQDPQVGDKPLGPIESLNERAQYEVKLLDTSYNRDLLPGLKDGVYGASFRFQVMKEELKQDPGISDHNPKGLPERTITEARVMEFGPVTFPAYAGATAGVRSLTDQFRSPLTTADAPQNLKPEPAVEATPEEQEERVAEATADEPQDEQRDDEPGHSTASRSTPEPDTSETTSEHKETKKMNLEEMRARVAEIRAALEEIAAENRGRTLDVETKGRWDELIAERDELDAGIRDTEERAAYLESIADSKPEARERGAGHASVAANRNKAPEDVFDMTEYHTRSTSQEHMTRLMEEGANRAVEGFRFPDPNIDQDKARAAAQQILDADGPDHEVAQRVLVHGSPVYRRAFWKTLAKQPLSPEEQRKMQEGQQIELRNLTAAGDGGVTVPVQIDPTVILTSSGAINPFRQVSKLVRTTSYQWQGVTSTGITAQYRAEGAAMTDNAPTLVAPTITPERADAFVPYTWEAAQDWASLEGEMASLFADAKDVLEATKFASGAGHASNEPSGVLTGAGTVVGSSATTTVGTVDIYALEAALPVRFQPNAVWLATPALFSRIRSQAALGSNSGGIWADSLQVGQPARLLGYPAYKASTVGTAGNLAVSVASTKWGILGDFSKFAIVDRIGFQVRPIENLFNGNTAGGIAYPNGMSGLVCYWRNSSGVLASNAFRVGTVT